VEPNVFGMIVALFILGAGLALIAISMYGRQRMRELMMRERIALIEKGLAPAPEVDPDRFDAMVGGSRRITTGGLRYRSAGTLIMGLGTALVLLLTFTSGKLGIAIGVGGGLVVLGAATFINGVLVAREPAGTRPRWSSADPPTPGPPAS
jgi:hypothetical protein